MKQPATSDKGQGLRIRMRTPTVAELLGRRRQDREAAASRSVPVRPGRRERTPKPARPVDAVTSPLAASRPERVIAPPGAIRAPVVVVRGSMPTTSGTQARTAMEPVIEPARGPVRGARAILDVLARRGVSVQVSSDGDHIVPIAPGGSLSVPGARELLEQSAPLLLAHLRGRPLTCAVTVHEPPVDAVTLLVGGCPACAECLA